MLKCYQYDILVFLLSSDFQKFSMSHPSMYFSGSCLLLLLDILKGKKPRPTQMFFLRSISVKKVLRTVLPRSSARIKMTFGFSASFVRVPASAVQVLNYVTMHK